MISKAALKQVQALKEKKYRQDRKVFLAEGFRLVQEAVSSEFPVEMVLFTAEFSKSTDHQNFLEALAKKRLRLEEVSSKEIKTISDTVTSQGVLAVVHQKVWSLQKVFEQEKEHQIVVGLDAISDPGNLGTLLRTCDWFAADLLLLGRGTVEVYNPKVVRSSMGAIFHVPLIENVDLDTTLPELRKRSFSILVTDLTGETFHYDVRVPPKTVVVLGNEAWGVRTSLMTMADARVRIKGYGRAESLNVSVACGVILSVLRSY
ncbi:MAG: RNA methyltransferase [Bacteroidota bacterium]